MLTLLQTSVKLIHGDMRSLQLLFVCWCFNILAVTRCLRVSEYACVSAYWDTVSCVLNISGDTAWPSNTTYSLKFTDLDGEFSASCPLLAMNHRYSCVCDVTEGSSNLVGSDKYNIELCHESGCDPVTKEKFSPSQNIQPTPPHAAKVKESPETVNFTWTSGYEDHRYLAKVFDYELLLQTSPVTESITLRSSSPERSAWIQRSKLKPKTTYCIKVRSIPKHRDYKGTWSNWSPATCWKSEAEEEPDRLLVILIKSLGPVCVAAGVMLFVLNTPAARMKIKTLSHIPSPAPFFQPLFQQHEGNFQEWLSPHGKFVLTYQTEVFTNDEVIIVPKPITKEPEENQHFLSPAVTQLTLTQGQTSYVGLPGTHEASPPMTLVCPRDTSYTQLPCSVWGVGIGEVEVASSPPKDVFNISRADSGCGCEDLTPSPECSLPSSPADDSPSPCYSSNYCILNKTAEGFAPVLVSKGSSINVPSVSLQEADC